ncbi:MAG: bifunctional metallophosphatase/5'-nucleotidase [Treponema sp.]|nr:bifunctional metallophosphatase/5'-nucleotidase [Treponema sp.]
MKKRFSLFLAVLLSTCITLWGQVQSDVTILYTNDIHTYITNTQKDKDGNKVPGLSYGSVAALRDDLKAQGKQVVLIDAGDHIQGTAYGAMDSGANIISFMNAAKYDLATPGNHEFDYGVDRVFEIFKEAKFPYIACNFLKANNKPVLNSYKIMTFGKTKVAFIGIMTPETFTKSTPTFFMDKAHKKFLYNFASGNNGKELYETVQKTIDEVSKKADYIVAVGHLGDDPSSAPWRSVDVIANTHGLSAFIDGHSHSTNAQQLVKDAKGNQVVLSQTGCYFGAIGIMTISEKGIKSELITSYERSDEKVDSLVKNWANEIDQHLNQEIAVSDVSFYINDSSDSKKRLVRRQETNNGDFIADAAYFYFNEVEKLDCDVGIANSGGIRADLPAGSYSYNSAKTVQPFGNVVCIVEVTGQELLDALEFGARKIGVGDNGGLLQVAGIKYTVNSAIPSEVETSAEGFWVKSPANYRVTNVQVYNRQKQIYEPLDLTKSYRVGGVNYILRNMGDGFAMFKNSKLIKDYVAEDYLITSTYAKSFAKGTDAKPHLSTKNSPLSSLKNYLIDYENPNGAGRLIIE